MSAIRLSMSLLALGLIVTVGCTKRSETTSTSTTATTSQAETTSVAAPPTTSAAASAPTSTTIASGTYSLDPNLRADLLEVKRVSGGALLVKWRIAAGGDKPIHYDFAWTDLYYVDPAENKKYGYLSDSEGNRILDIYWGNLSPGEQRSNWAKFPAPPATSTKISLTLPKFPPFEDVPVAQ